MLGVEGEEARVELPEAASAARAGPEGGKGGRLGAGDLRRGVFGPRKNLDHPLAEVDGPVELQAQLLLVLRPYGELGDGQLDVVLAEPVEARPFPGRREDPVHPQEGKTLPRGPLGQVGVVTLSGGDERCEEGDLPAPILAQDLRQDSLPALLLDGKAAVGAVLGAELYVEQAQEMVDLGHRGHGALASPPAGALLDGHRRRNAENGVDLRARRGLDELSGVGVEGLQVAALAFGEEDVEGDRALPAAADAGDDGEAIAGDVNIHPFEVVLAGVVDADVSRGTDLGGQGSANRQGSPVRHGREGVKSPLGVFAQRPAGVASGAGRDLLRRAGADDLAAGIPTLGPQVDDPVRRPDDVEVVFDHHQGVPLGLQPPEGLKKDGDVGEVQARGRFVEKKEQALAGLLSGPDTGQMAGQLEALRLSAAQGRDGLAEVKVVEPHRRQRFEGAQHGGGVREEDESFGNRQFEDIGDRPCLLPLGGDHLHLQHLGAVTPPVAVGAAQVDVAQELHLHMLETASAAGGAAPGSRVEAEGARGVAALHRQGLGGEELANGVEGADVAGRVGAGGAADGRLVDQHHLGDLLVPQDGAVAAGWVGRGSLELAQGVVADLLRQGRLARAAHPGDDGQPTQGNGHVNPLEVVFGGPQDFEKSFGGLGGRRLPGGLVHPPFSREVVPRQRWAGAQQVPRSPEKDDVAPGLSRAGAHIENPVGGEHHLGVMLHDDQGVAGVAQVAQDGDESRDVPRVQADARLVEDEEGVDKGGAKSGGQVDPLDLAAAEGARLAVEGEVAETHLHQVVQAGADLAQQQVGGLVEGGGKMQVPEKRPAAVDGQEHHVVHRQAGKAREQSVGELRPGRPEAEAGGEHPVGVFPGAEAPEQGLGLEPGPAAGGAGS